MKEILELELSTEEKAKLHSILYGAGLNADTYFTQTGETYLFLASKGDAAVALALAEYAVQH